MNITLTWYELQRAGVVAVDRYVRALRDGKPDKHGAKTDANGLGLHFEGAAGEMVFAKATGRYWSGSVDTYKTEGDVGPIQVRTRSSHTYELLVRKDDADEDRFVLVTGRAPSYRVVGWLTGREAKQPEWLQTHGGREAAYFVPHNALHALAQL